MALISDELLRAIVGESDHSVVKIELTDGAATWEAPFTMHHQSLVMEIQRSIRFAPGCQAIQNAYVRFPEGSFRSPDVAVYDRPVPDTDDATHVVPTAVIEVLSPGFEAKDRLAVPFYLAQGVRDVLLVGLEGEVIHITSQGQIVHTAPVDLTFACGCAVTIPL